jgi:hypothetical protein
VYKVVTHKVNIYQMETFRSKLHKNHPCSLSQSAHYILAALCLSRSFYHEDVFCVILQTVGIYLPDYTASHPRGPCNAIIHPHQNIKYHMFLIVIKVIYGMQNKDSDIKRTLIYYCEYK